MSHTDTIIFSWKCRIFQEWTHSPQSLPVKVLLTSDSDTIKNPTRKIIEWEKKISKRRRAQTCARLKPLLVWYTPYYNMEAPPTHSYVHTNTTTHGDMSNNHI